MAKRYTTKKKSMTKRDAKKAIRSRGGMSYPNTPQNRKAIAGGIDDFLKTLRVRDPTTGKVKITRKGRKAIKKARKKK